MSLAPLLVRPSKSLLPGARFLDSTWFMPAIPRDPYAEWQKKRIPSSRYLDLDKVASEHPMGLKHMMPSAQIFSSTCRMLGITPSTHVILSGPEHYFSHLTLTRYDSHGVFSSPRALFMFRAFGHDNSSVLDGGLPAWEAQGLPLETVAPAAEESITHEYTVASQSLSAIASYQAVLDHGKRDSASLDTIVVDARSKGRFTGKDPEPRPGVKSGHMPNSVSLPFNVFLKNNTTRSGDAYTTLLPEEQLKLALINNVGEDLAESILQGNTSVITSCGSGMTAGVLWLGLKVLGVEDSKISLYDESWTGYALHSEAPILSSS